MYYTSSTDMEILAATTGTPAETKRSKVGIILMYYIQIWTGSKVLGMFMGIIGGVVYGRMMRLSMVGLKGSA